MSGYWAIDYWAEDYWPDDYWPAYIPPTIALSTITLVSSILNIDVAQIPLVEDYNTSRENSATTSHEVDLPPNISEGDLLLIFIATQGDNTISDWDGFTQLFNSSNGTACSLSAGYKYATGAEGASVTITTTSSEPSSHVSHRITGHQASQIPEVSTGATGTGTTPNPDSLSPTGGERGYLWIAVEGNDDNDSVTAWPLPGVQITYTSNASNIGVCSDGLVQATLDPGTFTIQASEEWVTCTIAVYPTVAPVTIPLDSIFLAGSCPSMSVFSVGASTPILSKDGVHSLVFGGQVISG